MKTDRFLILVLSVLVVVLAFLGYTDHQKITKLETMVNQPAKAIVLDTKMPVTVHYETADGEVVLPPETMPLWKYVEDADQANEKALGDFKYAFEQDLHNHDHTFHLTHENIDQKTWDSKINAW